MSITMDDVRTYLDADEVDYQAAALLGPEALPHLEALLHGEDPMLAAKATYLASLIPGDEQPAVLAAAAGSHDATVRVAAASGLGNLDEGTAEQLVDELLGDRDFGVRRQAVRSASGFDSAAMTERVRRVAASDPEESLRAIAAESLGDS